MEDQNTSVPDTVSILSDDLDMRAVEDGIRQTTIVQAQAALATLVDAIGKHPEQVSRALHLVAETAETYRKLLVSLGAPGSRKSQWRSGNGIYVPAGAYDGGDALGTIDDAGLAPGGETFANQALQQILAVAKDHLKPKTTPEVPPMRVQARPDNSFAIEQLTQALATARTNSLPAHVVAKLESKLLEALEAREQIVLEPEAEDEVSPEKNGAAFLAGLAVGVTNDTSTGPAE